MPVIDEVKEQHKKIKEQNFKTKLLYFLDYYKMHTIIVLAAIVTLCIFIIHVATEPKAPVIHALMLNGTPAEDTAELMHEFLTENGYNADDESAYLEYGLSYTIGSTDNDTVSTMQKFLIMAQSGTLDFLIANDTIIEYYSDQMLFYDLRDVLPSDMLQAYDKAGLLVYAQMDPASSELAPVGIKGEAFPKLIATHAYDYENANPVIAAICTSPRTENMIQFLNFLEQEN